MSKRIGKVALINRLEIVGGLTKEQAEHFVTSLSEIMTDELSKGNSITFHKVCTIRPRIVDEKIMPVAGKSQKVPQQLGLKISISKDLKNYYKQEVSHKGKIDKGVRAIGDIFHKKQ